MATYNELVERYKRRKNETLVDTIAAGLTCADEIAMDLGAFDSFGIFEEVIDNTLDIIPFVIIIATEGSKVILGKKDAESAVKDASYRTLKSGAAIAVGAGVTAVAGGAFALPAAISVRYFFDKYKSKSMLSRRVEDRICTMRYLNNKWNYKEDEIPMELLDIEPMKLLESEVI